MSPSVQDELPSLILLKGNQKWHSQTWAQAIHSNVHSASLVQPLCRVVTVALKRKALPSCTLFSPEFTDQRAQMISTNRQTYGTLCAIRDALYHVQCWWPHLFGTAYTSNTSNDLWFWQPVRLIFLWHELLSCAVPSCTLRWNSRYRSRTGLPWRSAVLVPSFRWCLGQEQLRFEGKVCEHTEWWRTGQGLCLVEKCRVRDVWG